MPYEFGAKPDPQWSTYTQFIYPTPANQRWMGDRSVVDSLAEHGDLHDEPRRVDHWLYFGSKADRDLVATSCEAEGFSIENRSDDNEGNMPYGLQVYRDDPCGLGHIHSVTMMLSELAEANRGTYDGWETFIVRARD